MTLLFWSAVYLYGYLTVRSDTDWRALPQLFLFMAGLAYLMLPLSTSTPPLVWQSLYL